METPVKDPIVNTIQNEDELEKMRRYSDEFSWLGNQNHPPDIMIKGGDAIEVKKTQSANSDLALNSSYPKSTVQSIRAIDHPILQELVKIGQKKI